MVTLEEDARQTLGDEQYFRFRPLNGDRCPKCGRYLSPAGDACICTYFGEYGDRLFALPAPFNVKGKKKWEPENYTLIKAYHKCQDCQFFSASDRIEGWGWADSWYYWSCEKGHFLGVFSDNYEDRDYIEFYAITCNDYHHSNVLTDPPGSPAPKRGGSSSP